MNSRHTFNWILTAQVVLLVCLGWHFRHALNPDAVAYLRLASYYAEGEFDLAISGYWGPLLSWWLALWLKLGMPELLAARVTMAGSALVFVMGCRAVFTATRLPPRWSLAGTALAALTSAYWSVLFITPDLLLGGFLTLAVSRMLCRPTGRVRAEIVTGALWGLAYLTKAVALPVGVLTLLAFGGLDFQRDRAARGAALRSLLIRGLVFATVALPWVVVLSVKYQTLTFSTTARISHTLTGPADVERYHPFARELLQPEAGRVTSWEEPSRLSYQEWSPLANRDYFKHQLKVIARNTLTLVGLFTTLNLGWWLALLLGLLSLRSSMASPAANELPARLLVLPLVLAAVYLPFYFTLTEQRFFYATLPCFFAILAGWAETDSAQFSRRSKRVMALVFAALPLVVMPLLVQNSTRTAGEWGWTLAQRLQRAGEVGPVAGSGALPGGRAGLYLAFHLRQPWLGDALNPTSEQFKAAGAKLVVLRRNTPLAADLQSDQAFANLDAVLFSSSAQAAQCPLQVFKILRRNSVEPH